MQSEKNSEKAQKYYLGLDIGTDSVGYAVTGEDYELLKFRGEPMWGTHLFDAASLCDERRGFRTARRRLDRRQQRVQLIREIFAKQIGIIDLDFYKRLDASALWAEDKQLPSANSFFNDMNYTDKDYHKQYPTIHHLICDLMDNPSSHDVRLVYLAVAYLVAHRGHFLNKVDKNDIEKVKDFSLVYSEFCEYFDELPWECDITLLQGILKKKIGISAKERELKQLLFGGKKHVLEDDAKYNKEKLVKLLAGGSVKPSELFCNPDYADIQSISLSADDETMSAVLSELSDDGELILLSKKLYDWGILCDLLHGEDTISHAKVAIYEQHKKDLAGLKKFIKKYRPEKYSEIFRASGIEGNYVSYSYNIKSAKNPKDVKKKGKADFCKYLMKIVKNIDVEECDSPFYDDMLHRLSNDVFSFMPKQVDGDNRVIPYQLYYTELKKILDTTKSYLPFLTTKDADGLTPYDKILSVFEFRIPYFVGPLNKNRDAFWIERKAGKIYPWNFEEMVDLDASEQGFIQRMTNRCTYLPWANVLPRYSLLYSEYTVLNEINCLKINGESIIVEQKQGIYNELFLKKARVTLKDIKEYLVSICAMKQGDTLSGVDVKINSSLKSHHFFKQYLENELLTKDQAESIIKQMAYSEDTYRLRKWLKANFPQLSDGDIRKIANQNFKEFGRLSQEFLCEIQTVDKETGEMLSIIDALWCKNCNLMQLLSDKYDFARDIEEKAKDYYSNNPLSLTERLDNMYISNTVKRQIIRTLDVVKEVVKANRSAPEKIFIEMARGDKKDSKGKRTVDRRTQILEFYKAFENTDEINLLKTQLESKDDRELNGEALYLYFIQLGKCMYSGKTINIDDLATNAYNIDHIYPQCFVKDDSINNKVLVLSTENSAKGDQYPIKAEIQAKMQPFWKSLLDKGLISDIKYKRLTRGTEFTPEERWAFINRQLVETRQSTKAIATLLKELYPETEIVYVKAGLVSDYRQEYKLAKARSVNDLHHAKDAYLNIVVGNVYHTKFTKKWFSPDKEYSINIDAIFDHPQRVNGINYWNGERSVERSKQILSKNNIHLTRYSYRGHGGFFDQMPLKAGANDSLVPRKLGLETQKYGGYNRTSLAFYVLVKYKVGKKSDILFVPIEHLFAKQYDENESFAEEYIKLAIEKIVHKLPDSIEYPIGKRKIKINTVLELDGVKVFIRGKDSGGKSIGLASLMSLVLGDKMDAYVKNLDKFAEKKKANPNIHIDAKHDHITREDNMELYKQFVKKSSLSIYNDLPGFAVFDTLSLGIDEFEALSTEKQVSALVNICSLFKTCRKSPCDLTDIGGKSSTGSIKISSAVSNWKKNYKKAYIVDISPAGLYETRSPNLLDLL